MHRRKKGQKTIAGMAKTKIRKRNPNFDNLDF